MTKNLTNRYESTKHSNFIEFVKSGGRLSYKQIKQLNSVYKDDYMKLMLQEGEGTTKYLNQVVNKVQVAADEMGALEMQIED